MDEPPSTSCLCGVAYVAACGSGGTLPAGPTGRRSGAARESCEILTAADVPAATGTGVERIERNPAIGAGGTCVNFASADGQAYPGVNRLSGTAASDQQLRDLAAKALASAQWARAWRPDHGERRLEEPSRRSAPWLPSMICSR